MCTCASCSYTDGYAGKGFAEWPRGEPAGKRSSESAYRAHVAYSRQWGRGYDGVMHEPREVTATAYAGPRATPERLKIPAARWERKGYHGERVFIPAPETIAEYVADFERLNGLRQQGKVKTGRGQPQPVSPAAPGKAPQHFPTGDRTSEAATIYDMRKEKAKRSVGRPPLPGRRVVIKLEDAQIKRAAKLGGGNIAAGIRKALQSA